MLASAPSSGPDPHNDSPNEAADDGTRIDAPPEYWGLHNSTMVTTAVSNIQTLVPFILGISVANFYAISHTIVSISLCISINRNASAECTHQRTFCLLVYPRASFVRRIIQSCDYCLLRQEIHIKKKEKEDLSTDSRCFRRLDD